MVVVHLFGQMVNPADIKEVSVKYGLKIIEDCAQAHGARFDNQPAGTVGDVACFSFYPGKTLGAFGDAGMVATRDAEIARKCRMISNHGREEKYNHVFEGRNSRLDSLQAAILSVKLRHLLRWRDIRQDIANTYDDLLEPIAEVVVPVRVETSLHAWHLYVVRTQNRDSLQNHLTKAGIETGIHYPISLPMLPAYKHLQQEQLTSNANTLAAQILSLPIGDHMTIRDAKYVCESIKEFFE
jgi:dTDP-4-amino-4,6-dideoxygalactose transaminase